MNNGMVRCQECGRWYFNRWKLHNHLIREHDYEVKLEDKND